MISSMPCAMRGAQAALSPTFGAPATPAAWQVWQTCVYSAGAAAVVSAFAEASAAGAAAGAGVAAAATAAADAGAAGAAAVLVAPDAAGAGAFGSSNFAPAL